VANSTGARDPEEQKNDLMAALKAARELGPDMDQAVAASYLEKQKSAAQTQAQAQSPQAQAVVAAPTEHRPWPMFMTPGLGIMLYIVLLVVSHGWLWWTFWLIPAFGGWGWWGWRHDEHVRRRIDRYEWRRARYGYRYGPVQPPAGPTQPPQVQPPIAQQPQPIEYD
jgi:hypothetical protein